MNNEPGINTPGDLEAVFAELEFGNWEISHREVARWSEPYLDGFLIRWSFMAKDNMNPDAPASLQLGREWYIPCGATRSAVLKTAYLAAQQAVLHEFMEQFTVGGKPLLDPHTPIPAPQEVATA